MSGSFWLLPGAMVLVSLGVFVGTLQLDRAIDTGAMDLPRELAISGANGAWTLLSTIAASMITVAGVVFSITIVVLTLASTQFGPRLIGNFMGDRGNQLVLGTFIATFVYSVLVLHTVQDDEHGYFVPHLSVAVAVALALTSVAVLIYFIHHIAISIQAEQLVSRVGRELEHAILRIYPNTNSTATTTPDMIQPLLQQRDNLTNEGIESRHAGYLEAINYEKLVDSATDHDLLLEVVCRPGHFIQRGTALMRVQAGQPLSGARHRELQEAFILGALRTEEQDVEYSVRHLVEIALRALSPSLNDPFTAISCLDWLSNALRRLMQQPIPPSLLFDDDHQLRLIVQRATFIGVANTAFNQIRRAARPHVDVLLHMLDLIGGLAPAAQSDDQRRALAHHGELVREESHLAPLTAADQDELEQRYRQMRHALDAAQ